MTLEALFDFCSQHDCWMTLNRQQDGTPIVSFRFKSAYGGTAGLEHILDLELEDEFMQAIFDELGYKIEEVRKGGTI